MSDLAFVEHSICYLPQHYVYGRNIVVNVLEMHNNKALLVSTSSDYSDVKTTCIMIRQLSHYWCNRGDYFDG